MKTYIVGGHIVNEGRTFVGTIVMEDEHIADIIEGIYDPRGDNDQVVDATGCFVLPGVIDAHVHFRDPGVTRKGDIESESRAAAFGGVTSYFDMPNTIPQTTTVEAWEDKVKLGAEKSHVNYGFFFGATTNNSHLIPTLDKTRLPGVKLFMGASTGNMLVDKEAALRDIFKICAEEKLPLMTHCEDTAVINRNMAHAKAIFGEDPDIKQHPVIRSAESCYACSSLAVDLAQAYGTRLHIAHLSTARELELLSRCPNVTGEAVIAHLWFCDKDYETKGTLIKCNPSVKSSEDREQLRNALADGRIYTVGTDHAPHELKDKQGGCAKAASGMPMIQFSLVSMLALMELGVISMERLVELMCHHPADLFSVSHRGYLRKGYQADITIVKKGTPWVVDEAIIQSKCKWSPMLGQQYDWHVEKTFCNGHLVYNQGQLDTSYRGQALRFRS